MTATPINYETVLHLVYQLPARQRFTLIHDVLKSLEPESTKQPTLPRALGLLVTANDAPTDGEVEAWLDEHRLEKYG